MFLSKTPKVEKTPTIRGNFSRHEMILLGIAPQASKTTSKQNNIQLNSLENKADGSVISRHLNYNVSSTFIIFDAIFFFVLLAGSWSLNLQITAYK